MYHLIYLLLEKKLQTIDGIRCIDLYTGQLQTDSDNNPTFDVPAVLIDFEPDWQTTDQTRKIQMIEGRITLHIITYLGDTLGQTMSNSGAAHFDFNTKVFKALQSHPGKLSDLTPFADVIDTSEDRIIFNTLTRSIQSMKQDWGPFLQTQQTYKFTAIDFSATPEYDQIITQLNLQSSLI